MSYPLAGGQRVAWNPRIRRQYRHYGHIMDTGPARSRPLHTRGDGAVMISTRPRPDAGRGGGWSLPRNAAAAAILLSS